MDNDLIFGTETSAIATGAGIDDTQIAAVTSDAAPFHDALTRPFDAAQVVIPQGENVVREPVTPGEVVELPFPADAQFLARIDNGNLAIKVGDITVILQGYVEAAGQTPPVIEAANGQPLDIATILASTDPNIDIQTAAGPAAGPQGQGADNTGAILTQFGEAGGLGGFEGAGAQDGTDGPGGGTVDQTGTLFRQFGLLEINTVPSASDDAYATNEDTMLNIAAPGVLANDTDPDGDPLTATVLTGPAHGTVTVNPDGSFTYTPVANYNGPDSFTYEADDGKGGTSTATVGITVNPVNDAPAAANDSYKTDEDTPLVVGVGTGVLNNDTDVDGDPLTASVVTGPAHGTLTLNPDGSFTYTPNKDYNGPDSFTYKANDGTADSNAATVSINVNSVNDAPKFSSGLVGMGIHEDDNTHAILGWTIKDVDDPAGPFTVTVKDPGALPTGVTYDAATETFTLDANGNYDYLAAGESENFTITMVITDPHGATTEKNFSLTIQGKNDAADSVDDSVLTNVDVNNTFIIPEWAVLANDKDLGTEDIAAAISGTGFQVLTHNFNPDTNGTIAFKDDGTLGGTFDYMATDGSKATATVHNQAGGDIVGGAAGEILVGSAAGEKLDGGGGNDVIFGRGGSDEIFGGAGDDIMAFSAGSKFDGGTDTLGNSLALGLHGDVLALAADLKLADPAAAADLHGIETISMNTNVGGEGAQSLTIGAASVQQISDHTLTPGGVFTSEHDAVRVDGDAVDQLYLSISKDGPGTGWADTGIDVNGYSVYAHETTAGDATTADAYVMVSNAIPVANVHLNADQP